MTDLDYFHPAVKDWFTRQFDAATSAQLAAWPSIKKAATDIDRGDARDTTLINASRQVENINQINNH